MCLTLKDYRNYILFDNTVNVDNEVMESEKAMKRLEQEAISQKWIRPKLEESQEVNKNTKSEENQIVEKKEIKEMKAEERSKAEETTYEELCGKGLDEVKDEMEIDI